MIMCLMSGNPMLIMTIAISIDVVFQMEATIQLQIDPMHPVTKELLQQQQRRRSRPASEHPSLPMPADPLVSTHKLLTGT